MTNPINRISLIFVFALLGWLMCGFYAFGYSCGQKHELKRLAAPVITEYGSNRYDPNKDPMYAELKKQGLTWRENEGWAKEN